MKLIIDIPEENYQRIKEYYDKNDIVETRCSYIADGIPLEDIKAEIEHLTFKLYEGKDTLDRCEVLDVINNI